MGGGFDSQAGTGAASGGLGNDIGGGVTGGTGGQGLPHRSDMIGTAGGVAVSAGRGSDVGTVGGGMEDETSPNVSGGMSGGTMGGSRETDLGGGLSGGMRSGMGHTVSGGMGGSVGDETGMAQPHAIPQLVMMTRRKPVPTSSAARRLVGRSASGILRASPIDTRSARAHALWWRYGDGFAAPVFLFLILRRFAIRRIRNMCTYSNVV